MLMSSKTPFKYASQICVAAAALICGNATASNNQPTTLGGAKNSSLTHSLVDQEWITLTKVQTRPHGPKPVSRASECDRLFKLGEPKQRNGDHDALAIAKFFSVLPNRHTKALAAAVPDRLVWWMRLMKPVSYISISNAVHESSHDLNNALTMCNNGFVTYHLNGTIWRTDMRLGLLPKLSVASAYIPERFKDRAPLSRYTRYLVDRSAQANDFSTLIEEFNAYVGAASLEYELAHRQPYLDLKKSVTSYDGNIGGIVDFMMFTEAYLKYANDHSRSREILKASPLLVAHLQRLWTLGEKLICDSVPYQRAAGGLLDVSRDKLASIYSADLISGVDQLGLKHMSGDEIMKCTFKK